MSKYQQNDEPSKKITEYERGILYAFYGPVPATSNDEAVLLKVKNAVEAAEPELKRLRAENEKLRAASGSLVRSLSGCWYAFEPSLRREMGNTNYHCVKEKMDEVEALLELRATAAALKETEK